MPKLDLTITISVVIALCAILSPLITTALNNKHQLKMKQLEITLQTKKELTFYNRNIYEEYLKNTMRCIHKGDAESMHLYDESYALALIYFPSDFIDALTRINQWIITRNGFECVSEFNELSKNIRKVLETL